MINDYVYPQTRLKQFIVNRQASSAPLLRPVTVGPQYLLSRYGRESVVPLAAYAAASANQLVPFRYTDSAGVEHALPGTYVPDLGFTRLYGSKLEAILASFATGDADEHITVVSAAETNVLQVGDGALFSGDSGLAAKLLGRSVAVGDVVYTTTGGKTFRRKVSGLRGVAIGATYGTDAESDNSEGANGEYNPRHNTTSASACTLAPAGMDVGTALSVTNPNDFQGTKTGAMHDGYLGDLFTLTVTTAGAPGTAAVDVTSASGLYSGNIVSTNPSSSNDYLFTGTANNMGGLIVRLEGDTVGAALVLGQVFKFYVHTQYKRLVTTGGSKQFTVGLQSGVSAYLGSKSTTYLIEVLTGEYNNSSPSASTCTIRISDTAGIDTPEVKTLTDNTYFTLGTSGLQAKFTLIDATATPQGGLRKGDIYYVNAVAASESADEFDKIVLDGPAVDSTVFTGYGSTSLGVSVRKEFSGRILADAAADEEAWTVSSSGVTVQSGLALNVPERTGSPWCAFASSIGKLALYYRALVPPALNEKLISISDPADVPALCGPVDIDNDLGYGVSEMLRGTQGQVDSFFLRTAGRDSASFATALKKIEHTKLTYAIAPVTDDFEAATLTASHCAAISGPTKKRFRRCYIGVDSPGQYAAMTTYEGDPINCSIGNYGGANRLLTLLNSGIDVSALNLEPGAIVKLPVLGVEFVIDSALSGSEFILVAGPSSPISLAVCELWHADTPATQGAFVRAKARSLNNRRAAVVWAEQGTRDINGVPTVIPNRFNAAHMAGLRCALLPQQGLTRTEVASISDAPLMYLRYSSEDLDAIAADGVFILMQDAEGEAVYVRHQLTSGVNEGALAYEDSVGVGADYLSFQTDAVVSKYIGVKNLTTEMMAEMRNELHDTYDAATQADAGADAGPLLVAHEGLRIVPNATLKDRATIKVKWRFPLPFNVGDIEVAIDQDVTLAPVVG